MSAVKPRAIFFDWDGTAVYSRKAPADAALSAMKPLLAQGIKLVIVSGTTIENIAGGQIETYFTPEELRHLYLGLDAAPIITRLTRKEGRTYLQISCRTGKAFWRFTAFALIFIRNC